uniref:guanylate cyclase n=1 Tax=Loa loa TaxID=7209 RepID=A0A1I7VPB8_LOALO
MTEFGAVIVEPYALKAGLFFDSSDVALLHQGLEFLHASTVGYHGSLTPSQCLIDSHWILKLSGFGLSKLLYKWSIKGSISAKNKMWLIPNSDLHYYSPEMRRFLKNMNEGTVTFNTKQARAADIYAFGIILYEIVFHRKSIILDDNHYNIKTVNKDTLSIFCESAEALIPPYPSIPGNIEVHPDLLGLMHKCWSGIIDQRPDATLARKITDATLKISGSLVDQMIKNLEQYTNNLEKLVKKRTQQLEQAQEHAERLLLELLPKSVANELKISRRVDPKNYKSATVMYSDVVGFTSLCSDSLPMEVVTLLSGVFQKFDMIISQHQCYKFLSEYEVPHRPGQKLHCRWGFNTGPVFAGVVGLNAPRYCVFGQTVTLAAKMENSGLPDKIQITLKSYQLLTARYPEFKCSPRGGIRIDGIGRLLTYWLDDYEELLTSSRSAIGSGR